MWTVAAQVSLVTAPLPVNSTVWQTGKEWIRLCKAWVRARLPLVVSCHDIC